MERDKNTLKHSKVTLKPCICGGKATHIKLFKSKRYDCYFKCDKCGRETKAYTSKQNAAKAWNRGDVE